MAVQLPDVKNVFVYIDDAVRYDTAHQHLNGLGKIYKTIAASVHTPASFGSIYTGQHVPTHGIKAFGEHYSASHPTIFDIPEQSVTMSDNRISSESIYNLYSNSETSEISNLEPPFIHLYWAPGGHAPYGGFTYPECDHEDIHGEEYIARHAGDTNRLQKDYYRGVSESINHFKKLVGNIREKFDENETLCIYTSDHGELLGESGLIGHNHVLVPELVQVPTVFLHPKIGAGEETDFLRHVDILPTIINTVNSDFDYSGPGTPLNKHQKPGYSHFEKVFYQNRIIDIDWKTSAVWDSEGGYVCTDSSWFDSLLLYLGILFRSSKGRHIRTTRKYTDALSLYVPGHRTHGAPTFTKSDARQLIADIDTTKHNSKRKLSDEQIEHLKNLGYR